MSNIKDVVIPEGWKKILVGDIGNTFGGLSGKTKVDFGEGYKYIPYTNIYNNSIVNLEKLDLVKINRGEHQNKAKYGDIFFTTSSETSIDLAISSVLIKEVENLYLNSFCFGLRPNNNIKLNPIFSSYLFRGGNFRARMNILGQGSTRINLPKKDYIKEKLILPQSLQEQEKIAEILSTVDEAIEKTDSLIEKYKKIKTGLMEDLFANNNLWIDIALGDLIQKIIDNRGKTPPLSSYGKMLIETYHISNDNNNLRNILDNRQKYVSKEIFNSFFRSGHPIKGDILFSLVGERIPQIYVNSGIYEFCIGQNLVGLRLKPLFNPVFISYIMKHHLFKKKIKEIMMNNAQPSIKLTELIKIKIKIPNNIKEQEKIAKILSAADNKIEKEEAYKEKLEKIKKGLMNDLLTGKVRVKY